MPIVIRLAGSAAAVILATLLVWALDTVAPVLSLGVLYVFAVLPVAIAWGRLWALLVAVASMLAFNFFFLAPVHTFTLRESTNWFALAAYSVTAVVVSELAARARRRAADAEQREREASLLATIASHLLAGRDLEEELPWLGRAGRAGARRGASRDRARSQPSRTGDRDAPNPLEVDGRLVGTIYTPVGADPNVAVRRRFLPALAALLAVATDRTRLEQEALEAETLRRSDLVKTALIRAVSHDLRSPLTGITTAIGALSQRRRSPSATTTAASCSRRLRSTPTGLNRLVADLLDLSRLEAGGAEPSRGLGARRSRPASGRGLPERRPRRPAG